MDDDFTRKLMEDYFLILKDGRIVGARIRKNVSSSLGIRFNVIGLYTYEVDSGISPLLSPRGLDYDLYLSADELDVIMNMVPDQERLTIALPKLLEDEKNNQAGNPSSHDTIIAFCPSDKVNGETKHLLFISAPYLIQLMSANHISAWKSKTEKLRFFKRYHSGSKNNAYNCPDDTDDEYFYSVDYVNFSDCASQPSRRWGNPLLMCDNCGKLYLLKNKYQSSMDCPVCIDNDPEEGIKSVKKLHPAPWFQTFLSEYPS